MSFDHGTHQRGICSRLALRKHLCQELVASADAALSTTPVGFDTTFGWLVWTWTGSLQEAEEPFRRAEKCETRANKKKHPTRTNKAGNGQLYVRASVRLCWRSQADWGALMSAPALKAGQQKNRFRSSAAAPALQATEHSSLPSDYVGLSMEDNYERSSRVNQAAVSWMPAQGAHSQELQ